MTSLVLLEKAGRVAVLTLNRPERHNSLVPELLQEMLVALDAVAGGPDAGAVVLQANGRSFSTGGDLGGFHTHISEPAAYAGEVVGLLNRVILALVGLPVPVVAAVHGIVTGGSLGLVLGCDVVLVAPEASFTPYYATVGFSPDGGWTAMLPAIIGLKRAAEVLLCNRTITAEQAVAWGLASRVVPADLIRDEALSVAREIAALKPGSIRHTKRLLDPGALSGLSLDSGNVAARLGAERIRFIEQIETDEARAGIVSFLARRSPVTVEKR